MASGSSFLGIENINIETWATRRVEITRAYAFESNMSFSILQLLISSDFGHDPWTILNIRFAFDVLSAYHL